ncbi:MAG: hypothetical protein P0Y56_06605 [Candidatus Andeanibacterium colombiense]|uniref:Uncharacterized protein n=1 Tax=Candidatus Andeanibacterium colombiense TaxID=3121345 RepID=A0AAJ6BQQ8_9SPHN|nr:MAG: hypothetical protein P0Y56_06605 [Sphingomonadaceae bacterium]
MSRAAFLLAGAVCALAASAPAQAASAAFVAGAEAYRDGRESATRPVEQAEFAYCGGYWTVWNDALAEEQVSEDDLAVLSPVLQPPSAPFQAIATFSKLNEADTLNDEVEEGRVEARKFLADALAGDESAARALFGTLGACQL